MAETEQPKKETVRIELPIRDTDNSPIRPSSPPDAGSTVEDISSRNFLPPPKPLTDSLHPAPVSPSSESKRETVRIPLAPEAVSLVQKTPLVTMTQVKKNPMFLYWLLLGFSALILIIQIWTYFS